MSHATLGFVPIAVLAPLRSPDPPSTLGVLARRFKVNDLCRGLYSLHTFSRSPIRGVVHKVLRSVTMRAHQMLPLNYVQVGREAEG